jgi:hypothetical protein
MSESGIVSNIFWGILPFVLLLATIMLCWVVYYKLHLHEIDFINERLGFKKQKKYVPSAFQRSLIMQEEKREN